MIRVTTTWGRLSAPNDRRPPTIYEALKAKLGREPSHREIVADVQRIMSEGRAERGEG